jgi:copper chaperone
MTLPIPTRRRARSSLVGFGPSSLWISEHMQPKLLLEESMGETTSHLNTTGMHCRSCSMMVDMTVGELEGVSDVRTDHASGETVVTFDDSVVTMDQIVEAIRGAGYDAEPAA